MRVRKREVKIGNVTIGGGNPIAVQTMLNVPVEDIQGHVEQARRGAAAGRQIPRGTRPPPADAPLDRRLQPALRQRPRSTVSRLGKRRLLAADDVNVGVLAQFLSDVCRKLVPIDGERPARGDARPVRRLHGERPEPAHLLL